MEVSRKYTHCVHYIDIKRLMRLITYFIIFLPLQDINNIKHMLKKHTKDRF